MEKYEYVAGGQKEVTSNRAIAARYNAQHRFFAMSKTKQALAKMTGQWKKFDRLWDKAIYPKNKAEEEQIASQLDRMFRK